MRIPTLLLAVGLGLSATPSLSAQDAEHRWFADFDKAMAVAKDEGKDLLVDFTGSDWCGWCIKLHDEVFKFDEFYNAASKHYVLVALDYPNGEEAKAKVPNPERNQELSGMYGIEGFPTILLINTDGDVFGRTGYQEGGATSYLKHLVELNTDGKEALKVVAKLKEEFANADAKAKPGIIKRAAATLAESTDSTPGRQSMATIVRAGLEVDPKNDSGLKLACIQALLKSGTSNAKERAAAQMMDPKNEMGLYEIVVTSRINEVRDEESAKAFVNSVIEFSKMGKVHDVEMVQNVGLQCAFWAKMALQLEAEAKTLGAWVKSLGEMPEEMAAALEELLAEEGTEGHDDEADHEHDGSDHGHEHDGK
ncbi:MAG: thioredoxin family protein [Planctomycetes bacterium]|nr:thioredoxin family protein [Planctomycetota bacterium]